jgi:hypothetical protein
MTGLEPIIPECKSEILPIKLHPQPRARRDLNPCLQAKPRFSKPVP